jgi:DNA-directed RNA polymerase beta' subunit
MMGKRVDNSARAVLSPGWSLMFGQIGVPESFGEKWQMPVTVTTDNIDRIKDLLIQGKIKTYESVSNPGVVIHVRPKMEIELKVGDMVKRHIDNGDAVTFNRQPSLHKGSFLGYTSSMIKDTVIRLHPSSTTPHNADFDGDAAHLYFTENLDAIKEIFMIMHAGNNLINEKSNKPLVGLVMDTISAAWLLCKPDEGMDPLLFNDIIRFAKHKTDPNYNIEYLQRRAAQYGLHPYSGRTLFSSLFKDDFCYEKITEDGAVIIFKGILVTGRIRSTHIGTDHRSVLQDIWHQFDSIAGCDFLTEGTWLLVAWLNTFGLSIGPADCEFGRVNKEIRIAEKAKIDERLSELGDIPSDSFKARLYEDRVISLVDQSKVIGKNITSRAMKENMPIKGRQNAIGVMVLSGAKAGVFNIAQIGVSAGQQYTSSQRPIPRLSGGTRFLPTQPKRPRNKLAPITERGYCVSSYWDGMSPEEMFYLFWGARQNLIDTSRSTADVGATQRSISKALESMLIMMDGSGRDATGPYYFPLWGGDGLDSEALLQVNTDEFGSVPSFVDLKLLALRHNMMAGWMPERMLADIEENRRN